MNYRDWIKTVPPEITKDVLWKIEIDRLSLFLRACLKSGDVAEYTVAEDHSDWQAALDNVPMVEAALDATRNT